MKALFLPALLAPLWAPLLAAGCATSKARPAPTAAQDPAPQSATDLNEHLAANTEITHAEHTFLQSLVGTWTVACEATATPGAPPMEWTATETIRPFGAHWILAEMQVPSDPPFTSLFTLGYDSAQATIVATWIDTLQTHLWTYTGDFDLAAQTLTLEAEGPSLTDPTQTTRYRDVLCLHTPTQKTITSTTLAPDGTWTPYMTATATRLP